MPSTRVLLKEVCRVGSARISHFTAIDVFLAQQGLESIGGHGTIGLMATAPLHVLTQLYSWQDNEWQRTGRDDTSSR